MRGSVGYDRARKSWWFVHDRVGADGARRQTRSRGWPTKRDAERALQESLWQAGQRPAAPPSVTVSTYLTRRIDAAAPKLSPVTLERYRYTQARHLDRHPLGATALAEVTRAALQRWVDDLGRTLAPRSVRAAWLVLAPHLRGVVPEEALRVTLPRVERASLLVWSPAETRAALDALRGDSLYPLVYVAVTTGLRIGEQLALRWDDWQGGALRVERAVKWVGGAALVAAPKTPQSMRRVDLYPEAAGVLEEHRERVERRRELFPAWQHLGLVFARRTGGHMKPGNLSTMWQARLKRLPGVRPIRWHDLRHTHASHLLAAGVPVPTVAARLGHSPHVLLSIYSHLVSGGQTEAVRLGAEYLGRDQM